MKTWPNETEIYMYVEDDYRTDKDLAYKDDAFDCDRDGCVHAYNNCDID